MNSGNMQPIRPSMGSWLTYALGSDNQNLPGFVVLCPGKPVVGPQLWSNSFLPGIYQGTHINNKQDRSRGRSSATSTTATCRRPPSAPQLDLLAADEPGRTWSSAAGTSSSNARIASLEMAFRMQGEAQDAFDIGRETAGHAQAVRRRRVRQRLSAGAPPGRARRAHDPDLLRQRPALGRSRRHHQPHEPRPAERPAHRGPAQAT